MIIFARFFLQGVIGAVVTFVAGINSLLILDCGPC